MSPKIQDEKDRETATSNVISSIPAYHTYLRCTNLIAFRSSKNCHGIVGCERTTSYQQTPSQQSTYTTVASFLDIYAAILPIRVSPRRSFPAYRSHWYGHVKFAVAALVKNSRRVLLSHRLDRTFWWCLPAFWFGPLRKTPAVDTRVDRNCTCLHWRSAVSL